MLALESSSSPPPMARQLLPDYSGAWALPPCCATRCARSPCTAGGVTLLLNGIWLVRRRFARAPAQRLASRSASASRTACCSGALQRRRGVVDRPFPAVDAPVVKGIGAACCTFRRSAIPSRCTRTPCRCRAPIEPQGVRLPSSTHLPNLYFGNIEVSDYYERLSTSADPYFDLRGQDRRTSSYDGAGRIVRIPLTSPTTQSQSTILDASRARHPALADFIRRTNAHRRAMRTRHDSGTRRNLFRRVDSACPTKLESAPGRTDPMIAASRPSSAIAADHSPPTPSSRSSSLISPAQGNEGFGEATSARSIP